MSIHYGPITSGKVKNDSFNIKSPGGYRGHIQGNMQDACPFLLIIRNKNEIN